MLSFPPAHRQISVSVIHYAQKDSEVRIAVLVSDLFSRFSSEVAVVSRVHVGGLFQILSIQFARVIDFLAIGRGYWRDRW